MEQGHSCEVGIAFWFVGLVVSCCRGPAISAWPQAKTLPSVSPARCKCWMQVILGLRLFSPCELLPYKRHVAVNERANNRKSTGNNFISGPVFLITLTTRSMSFWVSTGLEGRHRPCSNRTLLILLFRFEFTSLE